MRRRWAALYDTPVELGFVGLTRMLFGAIVIVHLRPILEPALDGYTYHDRFHVPFWGWLPNPSVGLYIAMLWVGVVAGALMIVGLTSRFATAAAWAVVTYNVLLDQAGFHHNRAFLIYVLFGLMWLPTDRSFSLDAVVARRRGQVRPTTGFGWPLFLARALAVTAYLGSGISKALDADWRSGLVNQDRIARSTEHLENLPWSDQVIDLLTSSAFHSVMAPIILATELFIAAGLWFPRTRVLAVWVAVAFHLSIEIGASVQVFSLAGIAALTLWVTPRQAVQPIVRVARRLRPIRPHPTPEVSAPLSTPEVSVT